MSSFVKLIQRFSIIFYFGLLNSRGWSFIFCESGGGGHFAEGSCSEKEALPWGSFYEKGYKEILSCYIS